MSQVGLGHNQERDTPRIQVRWLLPILATLFVCPLLYSADAFAPSASPRTALIGAVPPLLLAILFGALAVWRKSIVIRHPAVFVGLTVLALIHLVSTAWAPDRLGALAWNGFLFGLLCWFVVVSATVKDEGQASVALLAATAGGAIAALIGILQVFDFDLGPFTQTLSPGSTFVYANVAAQFFAIVVPLALAMTLRAPGSRSVIAWAVFFTLSASYLIFTRCRGAWLGAALGCGAVLLVLVGVRSLRMHCRAHCGNLKAVLALALVLAMLGWVNQGRLAGDLQRRSTTDRMIDSFLESWVVVSGDADGALDRSTFSRKLMLRCAGAALREHWLFGLGSDGFRVGIVPYLDQEAARHNMRPDWQMLTLHCEPVQFVLETGVMGFGGLLLLAVGVGGAFVRVVAHDPEPSRQLVVLGCGEGLLGFGVHSLVSFPLHMPTSALLAVTLAAIPLGLDRPPMRRRNLVCVRGRRTILLLAGVLAIVAAGNARMHWGIFQSMRHLQAAWIAKTEGKGDVALGAIDAAMASSTLPYVVRREYGVIHSRFNADRPAARRAVTVALRDDPYYVNNLVNRAGVSMDLQRFAEAREDLQAALAVNDGLLLAHYALGLVAISEGRIDEAEQHFNDAVETWPGFEPAVKQLESVRAAKRAMRPQRK